MRLLSAGSEIETPSPSERAHRDRPRRHTLSREAETRRSTESDTNRRIELGNAVSYGSRFPSYRGAAKEHHQRDGDERARVARAGERLAEVEAGPFSGVGT